MPRRLLPVFIILLFGLSIYALMLLYTSLSASGVQADLKVWQTGRVMPDEESWQKSLNSLQLALKLDPANPDYLETKAKLYRVKARSYQQDSEQWNEANREALKRYQQLLEMRPSWAPYWAAIVAIKYDLWEFDQLMIDAMNNAARLAPWFKGNQFTIIRAGIHGWPFLDAETKTVIKKTIERAMLLQPKQTIKFAKEQGFAEWLDPYL